MPKFDEQYFTAAQKAALKVIDANQASAISSITNKKYNTVHHRAARALVQRGTLVEFIGPDGAMVKRRPVRQARKAA